MAMSPDGTADRGHHLLGGALGGLVPRCALQCCNRSRYPAGRQPQPPWWCEIRSGGRAAGPWPSARAGRQTGPSPGWRPAPAAWPLGRVIVGRSELQCCNRSRHPLASSPSLSLVVRIRSGGRAAGPWPSPRAERQTEAITWWATRSGGLAPWDG
ncbi:hypothetical protein H2136_20490 [Aeromonas hydrophila]|uniref:Uncharacterized protein n=1 Tax=Aeromonas hydrophila TaxID=644 RepID=A0A926FLT6_AERHY|nr:hypothetical protein [Aeromonas hydrophila]